MPQEPVWDDPLAPPSVLGLGSPNLPGRLRRTNGNHPHDVLLEYGDAAAASGSPFLSVRTRPFRHRPGGTRTAVLDAALASFLLRLAVQPEPEPDGDSPPPAVEHALILPQEERVACLVRRRGNIWVALAHLSAEAFLPSAGSPATLVTVAARGVDLADVRLAPIVDLEPFRMAARRQPEPREAVIRTAADPARLDAIEELIQTALQESPDPARSTRGAQGWMSRVQAEWTAAHRTQIHFAGQSPAVAARALMDLVDQMKDLAEEAAWWPEAGEAVIAESIRHTVFASEVSSLAAQELWHQGIRNPADRTRWLNAWEQWHLSWHSPGQQHPGHAGTPET